MTDIVGSYNTKNAEGLLEQKWNLQSFEDVKSWDEHAKSEIRQMTDHIQYLKSLIDEGKIKETEIEEKIKSKPFLLRPFTIGTGLQKNKKSMQRATDEIHRLETVFNDVQLWIDSTPENQKEANEIITELKLSKKQIDINKKEIQLQIKQIYIDTDQKIKKIEKRILFTSPKLKRLQVLKAQTKEDKNISPMQQALLDLDTQELEVDKMILWYEKIKYS